VVFGRVESEVKVNASHSEHQFFIDDLRKLAQSGVWPARYVIDWIYQVMVACHVPRERWISPPSGGMDTLAP
jgi:hypothetical protein